MSATTDTIENIDNESVYDPRQSLPSNSWDHKITQENIRDFVNENKEMQSLTVRNLWKATAWVYAGRLLKHVRTAPKKSISNQDTRNLTLSAAIAFDKGFPKEDNVNNAPAVAVFNNIFTGSDLGRKVQRTLNKALPKAQRMVDHAVTVDIDSQFDNDNHSQ